MTSSADRAFSQVLPALQAGNLESAEQSLKQVLRQKPRHVPALNLYSILLTKTQRFAEAERYIKRALQENTTSDASFYNYGIILKSLKRPAEALEQFTRALQLNPSIAETWNSRGAVLNDLKRYDEALTDFEKAIAIDSGYPEAHANKGKALANLKQYDNALAAFDRARALKPDMAEAWLGRGNVLGEIKQYDSAFAAYDQALRLKPELPETWLSRGNISAQKHDYEKALADYDKALAINPKFVEALLSRGNVLVSLKQYEQAFAAFDQALELGRDVAGAWLGRGNILIELKQYDKARSDFDRALTIEPGLAEAWLGRGNSFYMCKQIDDAIAAYDRALVLKPTLAEAWLGRGNILTEQQQYDKAFAAFDKALTIEPSLGEAWLGRGNIFFKLKQMDEARAAYDRALSIRPDLVGAWIGRGNIFSEFRRYDDALASYDHALSLNARSFEAWGSRGSVLILLRRHKDAIAAYEEAFKLNSELENNAEGNLLHAKMHLNDWTSHKIEVAHLLNGIRNDKHVSTPFPLLSIPSSPFDQLRCAKLFASTQPAFPAIWCNEIYSHDRIRVAYLSADFREQHPVAQLTRGLFKHHDKSRFEIFAISSGPDDSSETRSDIKSAFEHFVNVQHMTDQKVAEFIRQHEIDVAIDLMGFTQDNLMDVFARRVAPIQVNYLGYAGTTGADYIDYIIADSTVVPEDQFSFFSEQVVWLPETFQANDCLRKISERTPTRSECGLPDNGFVFCCFNRAYKITPEIFDIWMTLLKDIDDSVLWLSNSNSDAMANLRNEAERRGVSPGRLIFASRTPLMEDHLARQRQADLFLDTLPYNAHTTASDALWAGLPLVTCAGATFAARVAASLLKAIGLDQLITHSLDDYQALALRLARNPSELALIKERVAQNRTTHPLFNTERFTRHIEAAYTTMWELYQKGEKPKAFAVQPID